MMPSSFDKKEAFRLLNVSRETEMRLEIFVDHLTKWQRAKNLISNSTLDYIWIRHVVDSVQLLDHAPEALRWLDLGTGGGFPGIVLAICLAERTGSQVHCIESNGRKCAFLREAIRLTKAPAFVHQARIESAADQFAGQIDIVTARAVAPLSQLLLWAKPVLQSGAEGLFPKGQEVFTELTEARQCLTLHQLAFDDSLLPSRTDDKAGIVRIRHMRRL